MIYAGTADLHDDVDCAYILETVSTDGDRCVVEFRNEKRRGKVALTASYSYAREAASYAELLGSVKPVEAEQVASIKHAVEVQADAPVVAAITACIREGINGKMELKLAVKERAGVSEHRAVATIDLYTGDDPTIHRWNYRVRARGAKIYHLLDRPAGEAPATP